MVPPKKNHIRLPYDGSSGNEENRKDPRAKKMGDLTKARFPAGMNEDGKPFTKKDNTGRGKGAVFHMSNSRSLWPI